MRIVSVATHEERLFDCFVASARKHDIPLDILGKGLAWKGFGWRWKLVSEHLKKLDPEELILVTDAFDSIILKNAEAFEQEFIKFKAPIVFSSEPPASEFYWIARYYRRRVFGSDPIINGGTYIGCCKHIIDFISKLKIEDDMDDQRFLTTLYKHIKMTVDFKSNIFYHHVAWRRGSTIPNTCVVTFPADGYSNEIVQKLGYRIDDDRVFNFEIFMRRFWHYGKFFIPEMVVIAFVLNPFRK